MARKLQPADEIVPGTGVNLPMLEALLNALGYRIVADPPPRPRTYVKKRRNRKQPQRSR